MVGDRRSSYPTVAATTRPPHSKRCHFTVDWAGPNRFGVLSSPNSGACGGLSTGTHGSAMVVFHWREREREKARKKEKQGGREREMREWAASWRGNIAEGWLCVAADVNGVFTAERKVGGGEEKILVSSGWATVAQSFIFLLFLIKGKITSLPFIK